MIFHYHNEDIDVASHHSLVFFPKGFYNYKVAKSIMYIYGLMATIFVVPLLSLVILQTRNLCQNKTTHERFSKSKTIEEEKNETQYIKSEEDLPNHYATSGFRNFESQPRDHEAMKDN